MGKMILAVVLYLVGFLVIAVGSWFFLILGIWEVIEMFQANAVTFGGLIMAGFWILLREVLAVILGIGLFVGASVIMKSSN